MTWTKGLDQDANGCEEEYRAIQEVDISKYGNGSWFWPKSCERYNPNSPISKLPPRQHDLLDVLTFLAFANKDWMIRAALPYLYRACLKQQSRKTLWNYLQNFLSIGLIELVLFDKDDGNIYLVNPILMRTHAAKDLAHYDRAAQLIIKFNETSRMSRAEQLSFVRQQSSIEQVAPLIS